MLAEKSGGHGEASYRNPLFASTMTPNCKHPTWNNPENPHAQTRIRKRLVFSRGPCRLVHNEYGYVSFAAFDSQSQLIFQGPLP